MKKVLLVLVAMTAIWQSALAYSFSATAPTGQTLYFNIIDNGVEVTYPNTDPNCWDECYWDGYSTPTGALTIPS